MPPHLILNITTTKGVLEVDSIEENKKMKPKLQSKDNADNAQIGKYAQLCSIYA